MKILKKAYYIKVKSKFANYLLAKSIRTLLALLKMKDKYTAEHCKRVMKLCVGYSRYYHYPLAKITILKQASLLHDIGKIIVPKKILNKPDKLDEKEFEKVKKHSLAGCCIVKNLIFLRCEAFVICHHHERIDGNGYPSGITGNDIDELSKILSVCDAFDAMTNHRVYRKKMSCHDALKELNANAGSQFDSTIVENFCNYIEKRTVTHELSSFNVCVSRG